MAINYGWTEAETFATPWVRLQEYMNEIRLECKEKVIRSIPELPEEIVLKKMFEDNFSVPEKLTGKVK